MEQNKTYNSNVMFTLFGKGYFSEKSQKWVPSTTPQQTVNIAWCGEYILSERAKYPTDELHRMIDEASGQEMTDLRQREFDQLLRDYKLREFDAVAGAGTFSYGNARGLIKRSKYIVLDVDDLESTEEAREIQRTLIADKNVETALCFVNPKGKGIKWWVELPEWCQNMTFAEQYATLSRYIGYEYGILADSTGSNVNRLCFLPYDPLCYINPKYLINK